MSEFWLAVLGGSAGAAFVSGVLSIVKTIIEHKHKKEDHAQEYKEKKEDSEDAQNLALRYIMLYIIQERVAKIITRGWTTFDERRVLHEWYNCYHNGLNGNGDADAFIAAADKVRVVSDPKEVLV